MISTRSRSGTGSSRARSKAPRRRFALIDLEPNTHVPEHHHVNEQTGILLRGSMSFTIGDETKQIEPGEMWVIPADVPHSVISGPEGATLAELFAPPRADWAGLERLPATPVTLR